MPTTGKVGGVAALSAALSAAASPATFVAGLTSAAAVVLRAAGQRADGLFPAGVRLLVVIQAPDIREMTAA